MLRRKKQIKNKKDSKSQLLIVGSLLIILGFGIIGGKYLYNYLQNKNEEKLIDVFYEEQEEIEENTNTEEQVETPTEEKPKSSSKVNYVAVIKIPKIGLEKGLCAKYTDFK